MRYSILKIVLSLAVLIFALQHASHAATSYDVHGRIRNFVGGSDADGDGYYETFSFEVGIDPDVEPGPATVYGKIICNTTGQSWWAGPWTITGSAIGYMYFSFNQSSFDGHLTQNINLDFTVELWNNGKTAKLFTDNSITGEPIKADVTAPASYDVHSKIRNFVGGSDADGDGYFETFSFEIGIDPDVEPGPATVYGKIICNTTGESWWAGPWTITGSTIDYLYSTIDESILHVSGPNVSVDFTVELWDEGRVNRLATDDSVTGEPISLDLLTDNGPRIGRGIGLLQNAFDHIDTYFYSPAEFNKFFMMDTARRRSTSIHGHTGWLASDSLVQTERYDGFDLEIILQDADNFWDAMNQRAGVNAHVYAGMTFDYDSPSNSFVVCFEA